MNGSAQAALTRTVAEEWRSYEAKVIPPGASTIQITETRRAFYAGAFALLTMLQGVAGNEEVTEAVGMAYLESLQLECLAFRDLVAKGVY